MQRKFHSKYLEYIKEIKSIEMLNFRVQMQTKSRPNSIQRKTSATFTSDLLLTFIDFLSTIYLFNLTYIFHPCWFLWSLHTLTLSPHTQNLYLHLHFACDFLSFSGHLSAHSCLVCTLIDHNCYGRELKCQMNFFLSISQFFSHIFFLRFQTFPNNNYQLQR